MHLVPVSLHSCLNDNSFLPGLLTGISRTSPRRLHTGIGKTSADALHFFCGINIAFAYYTIQSRETSELADENSVRGLQLSLPPASCSLL